MGPAEPPPSDWTFPSPSDADDDLVGVGADLEPGTILDAYRHGLFPMPIRGRLLGWWSPDPRGILPLDNFHNSRSLSRSRKRFKIRVDTAFADVVRGCADPRRSHGWITAGIVDAYTILHDLGWVHTVEAWTPDGTLAGGLYGVAVGGLFAAESMYHRVTDAGKVALAACVDLLRDEHAGDRLLDVQWQTPHLATLGAVQVSRSEYRRRLKVALHVPLPAVFAV